MRNRKIDAIKGILGILVVLGHAIQYGSGQGFYANELYFEDPIFKMIYMFHMPFFALLSGMIYQQYNAKRSFVHKAYACIKGYIFPMAVAGIVQILILQCWKYSVLDIFKMYTDIVLYQWWFLWAIIIAQLVFAVSDAMKICGGRKYVCIAFIQIVMLLIPDYINTPHIGFMFFYFALGVFMMEKGRSVQWWENRLKIIRKKHGILVYVSAASLYLVSYIGFDYDTYIYTTKLNILKRFPEQLYIDLFRFFCGLIGCLLWGILFSQGYELLKEKAKKILEYLGTKTLVLYLTQSMLFPLLLHLGEEQDQVQYHYVWNILETLVYISVVWIVGKKVDGCVHNRKRRKITYE